MIKFKEEKPKIWNGNFEFVGSKFLSKIRKFVTFSKNPIFWEKDHGWSKIFFELLQIYLHIHHHSEMFLSNKEIVIVYHHVPRCTSKIHDHFYFLLIGNIITHSKKREDCSRSTKNFWNFGHFWRSFEEF